MIYTVQTKKALKLMFEMHKNQKDNAGMPYVFHPFHLAEQMSTEEETIVALLHDIIEDTQITLEDIKEMGFDDNIIVSLSLLTHKNNEDYDTYIKRIATNKTATIVKIVDLKHNSDLTRLDYVTDYAYKRTKKYKKYLNYLETVYAKEYADCDNSSKNENVCNFFC